jgi:hypothetical protein
MMEKALERESLCGYIQSIQDILYWISLNVGINELQSILEYDLQEFTCIKESVEDDLVEYSRSQRDAEAQ